MYTPRIILLSAVLFGALALSSPPARADSRSHHASRTHHSNNRSGRSGYSAAGKAYADLARANAIRAAATRSAQAEASRANQAFHTARAKIERDFSFSPEMNAAQAELARADRELEAARLAVRNRLEKDPAFQAAKDSRNASAVDKLLSAAFRSDADVQAGLQRFQQATSRMTELKRGFEASRTSNPEWLAARRNLESARVKLAQAPAAGNKSLAAANRARSTKGYSGRSNPRR